ncbi:MAG: hypothetical protein KDA36_00860 [Planctomycetaceae bacterium]|nr:hypothetical protein [Planctomycetaceae bacterium]
MSRRRSQTTAISLFPFLAVLICTMGALILLLLVTTRQIRQQEVARERARLNGELTQVKPPQPKIQVPAPKVDAELVARRKVIQQREVAIERQSQARERLQHQLQRERDRLTEAKEEFEALQAKLDAVRQDLSEEQAARAEVRHKKSELTEEEKQLLDDLEHARRKLLDLKARLQNAEGEFALVPYDGKSGTTRRPIFVECTERGFRILPEDILLTPDDMNGFSERVNPLLAGTEALTAFWTGKGDVRPVDADPKNPPYILLIVRPSGTVAYYLARRFLSRMKEPFGYELVEEDYPLHVSKADPQAKRAALQAIELTLASRDEILRELASRRGGSQEVVEVRTFNNDVHAREEMAKVEEYLPNRGGRPVAPPMEEHAGQGGPRGTWSNASEGENGTSGPGGSFGNLARRELRGPESHPNGSVEQGGNGRPGEISGGTSETPTGGNGKYATFADLQPNQEGEERSGGTGTYSEQLLADQPAGDRGELPETAQSTTAESTTPEANRVANSGGKFRSVSRVKQKPAEQAAERSTQGSEYSKPSESGSPGEIEQVVPDRAPPVRRRAVPAGAVPRSIAPRTRWGGNSGAGIGMQKKILIDVEMDKIIIEDELEIPLEDGESREMLARRLLGGIDWAASQWGEPHKNYFWIPVVKFRVHPGCLPHQARMQGVLQEWGVSSTVEFLKPNRVEK